MTSGAHNKMSRMRDIGDIMVRRRRKDPMYEEHSKLWDVVQDLEGRIEALKVKHPNVKF